MKVLRVTDSNDVTPGGTPGRPALVAHALEARFGEPVETVVKSAWPNERMPDIVGKWLDEERPDVVWLGINRFWFNYPGVPLRLRRKLGPLGDRLARLGLDAAANPVIGPSRPFRLARNLLLRTVGGDGHFEPEEILPRIEASIRRILRQAAVVAALERLARDLHFAYAGAGAPLYLSGETPELAPDGFHFGGSYEAGSVERHAAFLIQAIEAERGAVTRPA